MKKKFSYNPKSDLHAVDGAICGVNLREAYINGAVPAGSVGSSVVYNDVDDPSGLMCHPSDNFEAMRQTQTVKNGLAARRAAAEANAEAATE